MKISIEENEAIWVGVVDFREALEGGSTFSPNLLKKLADFDTEIIISNYCMD